MPRQYIPESPKLAVRLSVDDCYELKLQARLAGVKATVLMQTILRREIARGKRERLESKDS